VRKTEYNDVKGTKEESGGKKVAHVGKLFSSF